MGLKKFVMIESYYVDVFDRVLGGLFGGEFNEVYKREGCVIGGSIVISTVLGVEWKEQDIDIYIKEDSFGLDEYIINYLGGVYVKYTNYSLKDRKSIDYKYYTPKIPINIIRTKFNTTEEMVEYVWSITDLTICMSVHDGNKTFVHKDVFSYLAYPINFNPEQGKSNIIKNYLKKRYIRKIKYKERGFTIPGYVPTQEEIENYLLSNKKRKEIEDRISLNIFKLVHCAELYQHGYPVLYLNDPNLLYKNIMKKHLKLSKIKNKINPKYIISYDLFPFLYHWYELYLLFSSNNPHFISQWNILYT